jgi:hypothetical protein
MNRQGGKNRGQSIDSETAANESAIEAGKQQSSYLESLRGELTTAFTDQIKAYAKNIAQKLRTFKADMRTEMTRATIVPAQVAKLSADLTATLTAEAVKIAQQFRPLIDKFNKDVDTSIKRSSEGKPIN